MQPYRVSRPELNPILFKPVLGYAIPADRSVTVVADQTATTTGNYALIATGSLRVTIKPAGAVAAGAQWQVDGGAYQNSGTKLTGVSTGNHMVTFKPVAGYAIPADRSVTVVANITATTTGTYVLIATGSLKVTIKPAGAVAAGGQWQVDGGAYQNSGTKLSGLSTGNHMVTFKPVAGYAIPADRSITVVANHTATTTGTYVLIGP